MCGSAVRMYTCTAERVRTCAGTCVHVRVRMHADSCSTACALLDIVHCCHLFILHPKQLCIAAKGRGVDALQPGSRLYVFTPC